LPKKIPLLETIHTIVFDFDGVFTNNKVLVDQNGTEYVYCDRRDGLAFDLIRAYQRQGKFDAEMFILSKEPNPVVLARAKKMKLTCHHGIEDKKTFLEEYLKYRFPKNQNSKEGVIYLGNDLNDLPVMRDVGFSVAPMDAHPRVKEVASLVIDLVGGDGFVRSFVELLLEINNLSDEAIDELMLNC